MTVAPTEAGPTGTGLTVTGLSITRPDGVPILRDTTLTIGPSEVVLLVGPSGCGKSTLLLLLGGLLDRAQGWTVTGQLACGDRYVDLARDETGVGGVVFQSHALFDELDAEANLRIARDHAEHRIPARLAQAMAPMLGDIDPRQSVNASSGGQRQRIAIARTVVSDQPALLFDEPNSGLDIISARRLVELIRDLCRRMGKPALIAVHHASELLPLADRVLVMDPIAARLTPVPPNAQALEHGLAEATRPDPGQDRPAQASRWRLGEERAPHSRLFWFGHYVLGYLWQLCASPVMLFYIAAGAGITGFVTIWFGFNYYSYGGLLRSLLHDETLVGLGTVQARVALPLIITLLFVARNSAVIAADIGNRALTAQFQAMDNLGIPGRLYVFSAIVIGMVVGSVVLLGFGLLLGAWVSQETWMAQFPNQYRELFRGQFFRNVIDADGWPLAAMGWIVVKAALSGLFAALTSILIALGPKSSSIAVSRSVANAIVAGVIVALLVHAVISALTAI
jgi:ABC-type lipoprotein export system ATPase subunit/ABC-type transporter Mla maintaining outer membrane lipid asymmetry permease subunit MlaE